MENSVNFLEKIKQFFNVHIFTLGEQRIELWTILYFLFLIFLLLYATKYLTNWIVTKALAKSKIDIGVRTSIGKISRYVIITFGVVIILQTLGINLSSLTILAGALGLGIGFGLQNITNNFVSGIIILIERPIKVGDRIEVGKIAGDVVDISMRATTIVTNDNIAMIVPNSEFISSSVINWSYTDRKVRFNFPLGVSYKENPEKIREILIDVALQNDGVMENPKPDVLFTEFGDSSLNFNLRVWTSKYIDRPGVLKSQLYYEIFKRFKQEGIEIPFPQRDLHLKSGSLIQEKN